MTQELRRYFDTGVYHARQQWLRERFGEPQGEGAASFSRSCALCCRGTSISRPMPCCGNAAKLAGYKLGLHEAKLSPAWRRRLSANPDYWQNTAPEPAGILR